MISSAAAGLTTLIIVYVLFKRFTRSSLSMIRGPKSPSFIIGNLPELFGCPVSEAVFAWQGQYGNVVRFKGIFGEDRLLVTDPKALQKMLNISVYSYPRRTMTQVVTRMLAGKGVGSVEGEDHRRHRSIMMPGFGPKECKAFLPIFKDCAEAISTKWLDTVGSSGNRSVVINVLDWLNRGALDAIGHAVFDVQFGTIQDDAHPLAKKYKNYFGDLFGLPSAKQIFILAACNYIPTKICHWMVDNGSSSHLVRAREMRNMAISVAKELVREKADALLQGKGNTDIFTLLVKANMDANMKLKLSDEELFSQMCTLLLAGYETTATTISWTLLELARHPKVQSRLRNEIRKMEVTVHARGDAQLNVQDLEAMPYLNAVIKEGLRFHPSIPQFSRVALQDEILPLSKPILTQSGDMINEVLVPKGTEIWISIAAYNRDKDLWGEDAHEFNPDRWITGDRKLPGVGVYSHLMTFSSGPRGCPGWRFAVIEIQTFLSTLVGQFEFAMSDKAERILRLPAMVMTAAVEGELDRGSQLPLTISLAPHDGEIQ